MAMIIEIDHLEAYRQSFYVKQIPTEPRPRPVPTPQEPSWLEERCALAAKRLLSTPRALLSPAGRLARRSIETSRQTSKPS